MVGREALRRRLTAAEYVTAAINLLERIAPDDYTSYLLDYYREGLKRFGSDWGYSDIVTALLGLTDLVKPRRYLEIGVRRGRSVSAIASRAPSCDLYMFDMWIKNYAGMENPGQSLVNVELDKFNHCGQRIFVDGNSHETLPAFFRENPDMLFDIITVDGDHSDSGAAQDLCDVLPRLSIGGAVVFDDVCHPTHPGLRKVWAELVENDPRFTTWTCDDLGYGVGVGVRRW
jgi:predicted O-methyltransferase YrrM